MEEATIPKANIRIKDSLKTLCASSFLPTAIRSDVIFDIAAGAPLVENTSKKT